MSTPLTSPRAAEDVSPSTVTSLHPTSTAQPDDHPPTSSATSSQVGLRLLLVSGKKHDILVAPADTVETVKKRVFENWPKEWSEEAPDSASQLRLLLRGKFLDVGSTMEGNKIPTGQTTTVHLIIKAGSSTEGSVEKGKKMDDTTRCHCILM